MRTKTLTLSLALNLVLGIFAVYFYLKPGKNVTEPGGNSQTANTTTMTLAEIAGKYSSFYGKPIPADSAKMHINNYLNHTALAQYRARHFWIDTTTIKYFYELSRNNAEMDGIRIYLGDYVKATANPHSGQVYPKNTRTVILVATLGKDSTTTAGAIRTFRYHRDWYKGMNRPLEAFGDPDIYDYSDPCPPGKDCDAGADLGNPNNNPAPMPVAKARK